MHNCNSPQQILIDNSKSLFILSKSKRIILTSLSDYYYVCLAKWNGSQLSFVYLISFRYFFPAFLFHTSPSASNSFTKRACNRRLFHFFLSFFFLIRSQMYIFLSLSVFCFLLVLIMLLWVFFSYQCVCATPAGWIWEKKERKNSSNNNNMTIMMMLYIFSCCISAEIIFYILMEYFLQNDMKSSRIPARI